MYSYVDITTFICLCICRLPPGETHPDPSTATNGAGNQEEDQLHRSVDTSLSTESHSNSIESHSHSTEVTVGNEQHVDKTSEAVTQEHPSSVLHGDKDSELGNVEGLSVEELAKRIVANVLERAVHRHQVSIEGRVVSVYNLQNKY